MKIKKLNIQFGKTEKVQNKSKKSRKNKNKKEINKIKSKKGNIYIIDSLEEKSNELWNRQPT